MIIQKPRLCLTDIEALVDRWGQSIVGDLEDSGQADADHVGRLSRSAKKSWLLKRHKKNKVLQYVCKIEIM